MSKIGGNILFVWCIVLSQLFFLPQKLWAQINKPGLPEVAHYSKTDYRGGTQNWVISQTEGGLLYVGNNKGLLVFDGTNWELYVMPNQTIVRSVLTWNKEKIFVGAQGEFGFFEKDGQQLLSYHSLIPHIREKGIDFSDIWHIYSDSTLIYFCAREYVFIWNGREIEINNWPSPVKKVFFIENQLIAQDDNNILYKKDKDQWINIFDIGVINNPEIAAIIPSNNDEYLLFTTNEGFMVVNTSFDLIRKQSYPEEIKNALVYNVLRLENGFYAIGTIAGGLFLINEEGKVVQQLNTNNVLQNNTVLSLFQDKEKNLWLGLDNGLDYIGIQSPVMHIGSFYGLNGTTYATIIHEGFLYVGCNQGLYKAPLDLLLKWPLSQQESGKPFSMVNGTTGQVWSLQKIDEQLFMGHHKGLFKIENGKATLLSSPPGVWKMLGLDTKKDISLVGTYDGLYIYKKDSTSNIWKNSIKVKGLNMSCRVIEQDNKGHIWIAHAYKGLFRIGVAETFDSITMIKQYGKGDGLPENLSLSVHKVKNQIMVASQNGIYSYLENRDSFIINQRLTQLIGSETRVNWIKEDENGRIWFSSDNDFGSILVNELGVESPLSVVQFSGLKGKLVDGFEHIYSPEKSQTYIGAEKGLFRIDLKTENANETQTQVIFRKVELIGKKDSLIFSDFGKGNNFYDSTLLSVKLPKNKNSFRFSFSLPKFWQNDKIVYQYKLEGFDERWSYWTKQTFKEYTNLKPGRYKFQVRSRNASGQISPVSFFEINISPPWNQTTIGKIGIIISSLFFILFIFWLTKRKADKEKEELKKIQQLELINREQQFKVEFRQSEEKIERLKHQQLQTEVNFKNTELASKTMHLIQKTEILSGIKDDLKGLLQKKPEDSRVIIRQIIKKIDQDIQLDENWDQFKIHFDQVHEDFFQRLTTRFPSLSPKDQRLCAYLRMNLTTKEIAPLMNISVRGVEISRYRLRKKLEIETETNLVEFILSI